MGFIDLQTSFFFLMSGNKLTKKLKNYDLYLTFF
jgi:hypothetical protein